MTIKTTFYTQSPKNKEYYLLAPTQAEVVGKKNLQKLEPYIKKIITKSTNQEVHSLKDKLVIKEMTDKEAIFTIDKATEEDKKKLTLLCEILFEKITKKIIISQYIRTDRWKNDIYIYNPMLYFEINENGLIVRYKTWTNSNTFDQTIRDVALLDKLDGLRTSA